MKTLLNWVAALASVCAITACGGSGDAPAVPPPAPTGATLQGQVLSAADDAPLAGVRVSAGGKTAQSAADGRFTLAGVAPGSRVIVQAERDGYVDAFAAVAVEASASAPAPMLKLQPAAAAQTIDPAQPATVSTPGSSAQVQLPANALVVRDGGAAVNGPVSARLTPIDPASDPESMPGGYTAVREGTLRAIESFGAMKVDLRNGAGQRLQLATGKSAVIRIPLATRSPAPPATVPLFHFDETTGRWVQEGEATLKGSGPNRYYEGTVTHFSFWNADKEAETVEVEGCVVNGNGTPVSGVTINASGVDYSGRSQATTGNDGTFKIQVRKNATTGIWGATENRITAVNEVELGEFGGAMKGGCMVLEAATTPISRLAPKIMMQPRNQTAAAGEAVMLTVVAEGTRPLRYEWTRNGQPVQGASTSETTLWIPSVGAEDNGAVFAVRITNAAGTVMSREVQLTVNGTGLPPAIAGQPADATVIAGQNAQFVVLASGSGTLAYHWKRNGVAAVPGTQLQGPQYTTPATTLADDGALYTVEVVNGAGTVTSRQARLTVLPTSTPPVITTQPRSVNASAGESVTFAVVAQGSAPLAYRWQRNGADIAGASAATYTLANVAQADDGAVFRVIISNAQGSVTSADATLRLSSGSENEQALLYRLATLANDALEAASAPMQAVGEDGRFVAATQICEAGAVALTLDGATPAVGGLLTTGNHTLAGQFTSCDTGGALYDGRSSLALQLTTNTRNGNATATVTTLRLTVEDNFGITQVRTVDGQAALTMQTVPDNGVETVTLTLLPAAGMTVKEDPTGWNTAFQSGRMLLRSSTRQSDGLPVLTRQEYQELSFTLGGRTYTVDGALQFDFDSIGRPSTASGTVTVSTSGQVVGRVSGTAGGLVTVVDNAALLPSTQGLMAAARRTALRTTGMRPLR